MTINTIGAGSEAVVGRNGNEVIKKVKRPFASWRDAEAYVDNALAYESALREQGIRLPVTQAYEIFDNTRTSYGVRQTTEYVEGTDLIDHTRDYGYDGLHKVLAQLSALPRSSSGFLQAGIDSNPRNFFIDKEGYVQLIDVLPPLLRKDGQFPYEYIPTTKKWADSYMRNMSGVAARLCVLTLHGTEGLGAVTKTVLAKDQRLDAVVGLGQYDGSDVIKKAVHQQTLSLLASAAMRRVRRSKRH